MVFTDAVSLWSKEDLNDNKAWQLALGVQLIPGFFLFVSIWCKLSQGIDTNIFD